MGFLSRILFSIGIRSSRIRQLNKDFRIAEAASHAEQRIQEIDNRIARIRDTERNVIEEIDRLERERKFRKILADPIEEDTESQEPSP